MTDIRGSDGLNLGQPGDLIYVPRGIGDDRKSRLFAERIITNKPRLEVIRPPKSCLPPSSSQRNEETTLSYSERRLQKRWLRDGQPESWVGGEFLSQILSEEGKHQRITAANTSVPPFSIGQITNVCLPGRPSGLPALAMTAGLAGEALRIAKLTQTRWQWDDNRDVLALLQEPYQIDSAEEVFWTQDAVPISRIKFRSLVATGTSTPSHWLVVQKRTSTMIFCPEYHAVPVAPRTASFTQQGPSRIDPRPILSLSPEQTGGSCHANFGISTSVDSRPQLAIIDDRGYWSVWSVTPGSSTNNSQRASMLRCGLLGSGLLPSLKGTEERPSGAYSLCWDEGMPAFDDVGDVGTRSRQLEPTVKRYSSHFFIWNRSLVECINPQESSRLKILEIESPDTTGRRGGILDVCRSPTHPYHVFVLTSDSLLWIDARPRPTSASEEVATVLSCSHFRDFDDPSVRLAVYGGCHGARTMPTLAVVYSQKDRKLDLYWFGTAPGTRLPRFHHQLVVLPGKKGSGPAVPANLFIIPALLDSSIDAPVAGPGTLYQKAGTFFHQIFAVDADMEVSYWLCATVEANLVGIMPPNIRSERGKYRRAYIHRKNRKRFFQFMQHAHTIPDGLADFENLVKPIQPKIPKRHRNRSGPVLSETGNFPLPNSLRRRVQGNRVWNCLRSIEGRNTLDFSPFDTLLEMVDMSMSDGGIPLTTLSEFFAKQSVVRVGGAENADWDRRLGQLIEDGGYGEIEITKATERTVWMGREEEEEANRVEIVEDTGPLSAILQSLVDVWPSTVSGRQLEQAIRFSRASLRENFRLAALGLYTMERGEPMALPILPSPAQGNSGRGFMSSQLSYGDDRPSSQPGSSLRPATPSEAKTNTGLLKGREAIDRVAHLALSMNRNVECANKPRSRLLDLWPEQPGVSIDDYISSLRRPEVEAQREALRQRERLEARRRRAAERFGLLPKGEPTEMFGSQVPVGRHGSSPTRQIRPLGSAVLPSSSQTMGFPMSQPLPGAFGTRKQPTKKKKKTGIR